MSFKKRAPARAASNEAGLRVSDPSAALPQGVRASGSSGPPITSWGLRAIDAALGGGLPIGTTTLVIEDEPSAYHLPLISYVSAQGLQFGHAIAVASLGTPAQGILENLPACVEEGRHVDEAKLTSVERRNVARMEIAWRYQKNADPSTHIVSGENVRSFASNFDLSQRAELPKNAAISSLGLGVSDSMDDLLAQLGAHLDKASKRKLFSRIVIHGVSKAYFGSSKDPNSDIATFLCRVRSLTRVYGAIAVISCGLDVPYRIASIAVDAVLRIDSFGGRGAGVAGLGKEWLGVMIVKKTFRDGKAPCLRGKGDVWVFKRGRRKYVMERATAAPDEDNEPENSGRADESLLPNKAVDDVHVSNVCGAKPGTSKLDF